jgi:uracil-DNA glycosylase
MTTSWNSILREEAKKPYYQSLMNFINAEYAVRKVYPEYKDIFSAILLTPFDKVKVVVVGQDPYFSDEQANGLAFSVRKGTSIPPSLRNIFIERENDLGYDFPMHGDLTPWAHQGVLLLNSVLTVRASEPNSHKGAGWEILTTRFIAELSNRTSPIVFMLWGKAAQEKASYLTARQHLYLESSHPSPHSANKGFFGSRPFSQANQFLTMNGVTPIDWRL